MAGAACSAPLFSQPCNVSPQAMFRRLCKCFCYLLKAPRTAAELKSRRPVGKYPPTKERQHGQRKEPARTVSRDPQGHLFCGKENPERCQRPRSRKSSKLHSRSTRLRPKNTSRGLRRYSKRSMKRLVAKPAMRSWGSSRKVRT